MQKFIVFFLIEVICVPLLPRIRGEKDKENNSANYSLHFEGFYHTNENIDCVLLMETLVASVQSISMDFFKKGRY